LVRGAGKMKTLKFLLFAAGIFLLFSCSELSNQTSPATLFGLPHVAIEMRESDFNALMKDALVNEFAAINITQNGVKQTGRMRRRGHSSRYFPKPSFHVITNDNDERRHFVASNIDRSYLRQIFANMIFEANGFIVPKMEFVALSVNNVFVGLYLSREHIDERFFRRRNIEVNSLYEIRSGGRFTFGGGLNSAMSFDRRIPESSINFSDLNILISALDEGNETKIKAVLDIENAAMYSLTSSAINNHDGIIKNLYIYNCKSDNKFRIIPYDLDQTFGQTFLDGFAIPNNFPKFENGLLERAEEIFLRGGEYSREQNIRNIALDIERLANSSGALDNLANSILQSYNNDPFLRGEDLGEHIAEIRRFLSEMSR